MKTLKELEELPADSPLCGGPHCAACDKPTPTLNCEVIVYRTADGRNLTWEETQAKPRPEFEELTVAYICCECAETLYV